jgi:hypothetical protein
MLNMDLIFIILNNSLINLIKCFWPLCYFLGISEEEFKIRVFLFQEAILKRYFHIVLLPSKHKYTTYIHEKYTCLEVHKIIVSFKLEQ